MLLFCTTQLVYAHSISLGIEKDLQEQNTPILLEIALNQLAEEYQANLLFDPLHLQKKLVKPRDLEGQDLEQVLKKILPPLQLSFKNWLETIMSLSH